MHIRASIGPSILESFRRFRHFGCIVFCLSFFASVDGHWMLLQSIAWTRMTVQFSKTVPVTQAVVEAIGGKRPCKRCHEIAKGRAKEERKDSQKTKKKTEPLFCSTVQTLGEPFHSLLRYKPDAPLPFSYMRPEPLGPPPRSRS